MPEVREAWSTHNTKVAASLNALGWPVKITVTERAVEDNLTGDVLLQLSLYEPNVRQPALKVEPLVKAWERGELSQQKPMHPFLIGLRACNAYDDVQRMIKGQPHRLKLAGDDHCCVYALGTELPALMHAGEVADLSDMSLACALSVMGFPVIQISGEPGRRVFRLPRFGHQIKRADGIWYQPDIITLIKRAEPGQLSLLLEQTEPNHPLIHAYNARHVHGQLLRRINEVRRTITVSPRQHTGAYSFISEFANNRVMDRVQRHLKLAPE